MVSGSEAERIFCFVFFKEATGLEKGIVLII